MINPCMTGIYLHFICAHYGYLEADWSESRQVDRRDELVPVVHLNALVYMHGFLVVSLRLTYQHDNVVGGTDRVK